MLRRLVIVPLLLLVVVAAAYAVITRSSTTELPVGVVVDKTDQVSLHGPGGLEVTESHARSIAVKTCATPDMCRTDWYPVSRDQFDSYQIGQSTER